MLQKIIRRHVWANPSRESEGLGPHAVTVLTVEFPVHQPNLRDEAHGKVGEQRFLGELGEVHPQRATFRAPDCIAQRAVAMIPFLQKVGGVCGPFSRHFQTYSGPSPGYEPEFCHTRWLVNLSWDTGLNQALADRFRTRLFGKQGHSNSAHKS
jgi:hypothetical protein